MGATGAAGTAADADLPGGPVTTRYWWAGHEGALPEGVDWLSSRERVRLDAMRFTKRRTEYLLRRWVGKRAVAARLGRPVDPPSLARVEVLNRPTGAPYVEIDGAATALHVSLTDRAGCGVAVIGAGAEVAGGTVGVDLELVEPRTEGFVTDFLTAGEQEWVRSQGRADGLLGHDAAANLLWSAKEAALKVLHLGLRADTRWVEVVVGAASRADGWAPFTATWRDGEVLSGWWRRDRDYLLTVATVSEGEPPVALPGTLDLVLARPVHSWVGTPLVSPGE